MGVDTQLHVKSKVTDPSAVTKLERKLTMTLKSKHTISPPPTGSGLTPETFGSVWLSMAYI